MKFKFKISNQIFFIVIMDSTIFENTVDSNQNIKSNINSRLRITTPFIMLVEKAMI